ncbi:DUF481 domain-containing protein [Cyclobacterium salsum]|uniref:DUF481 domain-containing protein n=1 Tax=Cyclobacterium salsum TaxID=2666329 RepID=UPI0013916E62|nr:DUF481 domain-containing protein [Cyclobacterium salsum]
MRVSFIFTLLSCLLLFHQKANAQVLHTENFNVIIDTTKVLKGNFTPSFRYRNLKEDFLELANTADVSFRFGKHAFTVANRIEYSFLGDENILSGGFLYLEYVNIQSKKIAIEPFYQMHWNEVRGLDNKYAGGMNLRWRALVKNNTGLYFGIGSLYEFERWNYSGVPDDLLPIDQSAIEVNRLRGNSYVSFKQSFGDLFDLDISGYYQPNLSDFFKNHRLASSFELTYNITKYIGLRLLYQNIYDSAPLVPIDKLYHDVNFGITISF